MVDLAPLMWGPAFEENARDDELFAQVRVDPEIGTIVWPNGADLDPDVLHDDLRTCEPGKVSFLVRLRGPAQGLCTLMSNRAP